MQTLVFRALADETRLAITAHLVDNDCCMCVCELVPVVDKDQSTIYRHVVALSEAGLVTTRKDGRRLMCCATKKAARLLENT